MSILDRDALNAFCRHTHVALPGVTSGPLAGLTFGLKDIYDVAGHRTGFGSPDWLTSHEPARASASVVTTLLAAGASMVGKTHTEEMAFSLTGENAHYGTPVNPAAPARIPGGSSSGSAAAVAGQLVDFAIGSDTGGSVRGPASFCGVLGIRPTYGRIPMDGVCPLAPMFDTVGWFARNADLLARVGDVLFAMPGATGDDARTAAAHASAAPARLLMAEDAFALATPEAAAALRPAATRAQSVLGAASVVTVSPEGLPAWYDVFRALQFANIWETHHEWVTRVRPTFGYHVGLRFEAVAKVTPDDVLRATRARERIVSRLDDLLADDAILMLPTMPDIAPLRNTPPDATIAFRERSLALLCIAGLGGLPQVSLPLATLGGCPLGLSLIAARGHDQRLLHAAQQIMATNPQEMR